MLRHGSPTPSSLKQFQHVRSRIHNRVEELVRGALNHHGERREILRRYVYDVVSYFAPFIAVERDGITYYVSTSDRALGRYVFGSGTYSQRELGEAIAIIEFMLDRKALLSGRTFVDIGANIGTTTIPAVKVFGARTALAFEPEPNNFRLLQCNIIANELADRIEAHQVALSDTTGMAILELCEKNSGDNRVRVRNEDGLYQEVDRRVIEIATTQFDQVVLESAFDLENIGLVWMDTQGHEGHILAGAQSITSMEIPIVMEYWPYALQRGDNLRLLHQLVETSYRTVIDLRKSMGTKTIVQYPADRVWDLESAYPGLSYTDLILLH
jgi:FkbM family methyltransferase